MDTDGTQSPMHRCTHQTSERFGTDVSVDDCASCPVRVPPALKDLVPSIPILRRDFGEPKIMPDGSIVYRKTGLEAPICPNGYRRKSDDLFSDDAWVFLPLWKPCLHREMANIVRPCGCVQVRTFCLSDIAGRYGKTVTTEICAGCTVRRPPEGLD